MHVSTTVGAERTFAQFTKEKFRLNVENCSVMPHKDAKTVSASTTYFGRICSSFMTALPKLGSVFIRNQYLKKFPAQWKLFQNLYLERLDNA